MKREKRRFLVPQPMATFPLENYPVPRPHLLGGEKVQVLAFKNEHGKVVEKWHLSDTDIRWYEVSEDGERKVESGTLETREIE